MISKVRIESTLVFCSQLKKNIISQHSDITLDTKWKFKEFQIIGNLTGKPLLKNQ